MVPVGAPTANLLLDVLGQAPGTVNARIAAAVPAGWRTPTLSPASPLALVSNGLPVQRTVTVGVRVPAGTPAGTYPVTVTVSGAGATITRQATVVVRAPAACASTADGQCAVDLAAERTKDGTATVAATTEGDFDGGGWSYDAALLPAEGTVTWGGVTYATPDPGGTAANFVQARGQAILLPAGAHGSLRLVATTHNGPVTAGVTIGYADGSVQQVPVTIADWCGSAATGTTTVLAMPHRIKAGQGVDGPAVNLFAATIGLDAGKQVRSITLPDDPRLHVYAATLT